MAWPNLSQLLSELRASLTVDGANPFGQSSARSFLNMCVKLALRTPKRK